MEIGIQNIGVFINTIGDDYRLSNVYSFTEEIAHILMIPTPKIEFVDSLRTATQLAETIITDGNYDATIRLKSANNDLDMVFAIAHECRHIFQHQNKVYDLEFHMSNEEISTRQYNLQSDEIDANAFATKVMLTFFGVKPLFNGVDDDVRQLIYQASQKIILAL